MKKKAHGTTEKPVQENLKWKVDRKRADKICCYNRHYAEYSGYFLKTSWLQEMEKKEEANEPQEYYDSVTGRLLFTAPIGRTFEEFLKESKKHGWPSFRDAEVNWEHVRVLSGGETVSVDGTHLGHNLPDKKGNRYCINLICVAGNKIREDTLPPIPSDAVPASAKSAEGDQYQTFVLKKDGPGCTGLFFRSNPKASPFAVPEYKDWPRDGAMIKGTVVEVEGEKWLKCEAVKQPSKKKFAKTKGKDVWLPFRHEQHFLEEVDGI